MSQKTYPPSAASEKRNTKNSNVHHCYIKVNVQNAEVDAERPTHRHWHMQGLSTKHHAAMLLFIAAGQLCAGLQQAGMKPPPR